MFAAKNRQATLVTHEATVQASATGHDGELRYLGDPGTAPRYYGLNFGRPSTWPQLPAPSPSSSTSGSKTKRPQTTATSNKATPSTSNLIARATTGFNFT